MKQLIINCAQFTELNEEQQNILLERYSDDVLNGLTSEDIVWEFSVAGSKVAEAGFLDPDVHYSLTNSQGDGACFDCSLFNYDLLLEDLDIPHKSLFIKLLEQSGHVHSNIIKPNANYTHYYCHECCRIFTIHLLACSHNCPRVSSILSQIQHHIEQKRYNLCLEIKTILQQTIDCLCSKESVSEHLIVNEYYFRVDTLERVSEDRLVEIKEEN